MIARHNTFINEPLSSTITILHLFCPNEPPVKQTYEPHRKTKQRNMCILVKKKKKEGKKREKKNEGEKKTKKQSPCNMWRCSAGGWR